MAETVGEREEHGIRRTSTFASLRNRNFLLFWIGGVTFFVGMQMQMVAQGWLVLELTNSPFYLGLVGAVSSIPVFFLSLFGGVLADRVDRRNILVITQALMLCPVFTLALLITANVINVWFLLAFSALSGTLSAFNMPARQAYVADLVKRNELMNAIALFSAGMNMTRIIGPSIGGVLIGAVGVAGAYYLNSTAYVVVVATLLMIPAMGQPILSNGQNMWQNIGEGFRYIKDNEIILILLLIGAFAGIFGMSYQILLPAFARDVLNQDAKGLGFLMGASGIGALAGSLTIASLGNVRRKGWIMIGSGVGFGASIILFAFSPSVLIALAIQVFVGAISTAAMAVNNTILQTVVPNELRGRVMSIMMLTFGLMPIGSLLSGAVATLAGTPIALAINGTVVMLSAIIAFVVSPAIRRLD